MAVLTIDAPMDDAQAESLVAQLADCEAVDIKNHDLGGAVVQLLLCASAQKPVRVLTDSASLKMLFENPQVEQG